MRTWKCRLVTVLAIAGFAVLVVVVPAMAYTFPSTNELNKARSVPGREGQLAPYVEQVSAAPGTTTLHLVGGYAGIACFEYRLDGAVKTSGTAHPVVTGDFIYPNFCVGANLTRDETFVANSKVEIRLALGGERDWDFDWTTFGIPNASVRYDDVSLSGGFQSGHFPELWSLSACDLTLSATADLNGLSDAVGAHAWAEFGVRTLGAPDFNPTFGSEGSGVWLATDYDWTAGTFAPDPPGAPTLDLDDKLILQKAGGHGESDYNLPSTPPSPGSNHRFWWDRDGVDPWQNGETANTAGLYDVVISLKATSATTGTAFMSINGLVQGFETDGDWSTIELTPAGMTFTGDMEKMQVFYGLYGYGATHSVAFRDIEVTGCETTPPTITIATPEDDAVYALNQSVPADYACSDSGSGVSTCEGDVADGTAIDTSSVGAKSFTVVATDNAGNTSSLTHHYSVVYGDGFSGFFEPIDTTMVNAAKAGQSIPVKWRLLDDNGQPIGDPTSFTSITSSSGNGTCGGSSSDAIEEYAAGASGLQYLGDGYWQFNWKTPKSYAGQCRTMTLTLNDGSTHTASFAFK